ncbi:MAG: hypothetical protein V1761_00775 [bacterium]
MEKSLLVGLFAWLPVMILLWTLLVFTVLFFSGASLTFNDINYDPGDPGYREGFLNLVYILGGITLTLALISALITIKIQLQPLCYFLATDYSQHPVTYMKSRRHEILTTSEAVFDLDRRTGRVRVSRDPIERDAKFAAAFFWLDPVFPLDGDVRTIRGGIRLKTITPSHTWGKRIRTFRIRFDAGGKIASYVETIEERAGGSSRLVRWSKRTLSNIDRHMVIAIHPEIRKLLTVNQIIL